MTLARTSPSGDLVTSNNVTNASSIAGATLTDALETLAAMQALANPALDVQSFSGPGVHTWTKPPGAQRVDLYIFPVGGPSGSGRKSDPGTASAGGASGCNGAVKIVFDIDASLFGATETVTIGADSVGGAPQTVAQTNGNPGTIGGTSSFGSFLSAPAGNPGSGGTTANNSGGPSTQTGFIEGSSIQANGQNFFTGFVTVLADVTGMLPSPGVGGSGVTAGGIPHDGGAAPANAFLPGGTAGVVGGANAGNGASMVGVQPIGGTGGGSGAGATSGNAGDGGDGGFPSGSGGGGGGVQGAGNSGKGGKGGGALIIAITSCN